MHRPSLRFTAPLLVLSGLSLAPSVLANGRYPFAQQLLVDPSDDKKLWMRTTFGILTSNDGGTSWRWLCEAAVGYDQNEDPMMAVLGSGNVIAGASTGLYVTQDRGCDWPLDATIGSRYVRDVAAEHDAKNGLALTLKVSSDSSYDAIVYRSTDSGATWAAMGPPISTDLAPITIDPAPSDPNRLYVSAAATKGGGGLPDAGPDAGLPVRGGPGVLLRSRDGGKSWERRRIPGSSLYDQPFIAAVHPTNPDVLYVRVQGDATSGGKFVKSWLLYTSDAGDTWKQLVEADADMLGFALSPDGSTVYYGLGDTKDVSRRVNPDILGVYRASAPQHAFQHLYQGHVGCLTLSGSTLFVCGPHGTTGFDLGVSEDQGATVTPILGLHGIDGPLLCPSTTPQAIHCESGWPSQCELIAECPLPKPDAGTTQPDAGTTPTTRPKEGGSCSCSSPGRKSSPSSGSFAAFSALLLGLVQRARRRGR